MRTSEELAAALAGLYAYDVGATDSGIRDERLRQIVVAQLAEMLTQSQDQLLDQIARDVCPPDQGYTEEDVAEFRAWIAKQLRTVMP